MILIGMFDSPYTRRVAISANLLGIAFEHRNWSVGSDFDRIRAYNPLGRVPALVLHDGQVLTESSIIVDYLDQLAGPERALLPADGAARLQAQKIIAITTGAVDKGIHVVIERVFRPADKHHAPWTDRCRTQVAGACAELEGVCANRADCEWLVADAITQADVTLACYLTYLHDAMPLDLGVYPALDERIRRYESQPAFSRFHVPFEAPVSSAEKAA